MGLEGSASVYPGLSSLGDRRLVEQQLKKVLESELFRDASRMSRFLEYVVRAALNGKANEIKGYSLGVDVFDRPADFDPGSDTIVRVQANKLRTRLNLFYAGEGRDDPVRIHLPKGNYKPVFEISYDPGQIVSENIGNSIQQDSRSAIAIMPFENLSGEPGRDCLAIAFSEEVLIALSRFRELRVLSRHVTSRYLGQAYDPREVGAELGVGYLIEGTFQQIGDRVRVTVNLSSATTGDQIFSDRYDRDLTAQHLFEIQEDVAGRTAAKIAEPHGYIHRAGLRRQSGTQILDAYQAQLLATEYWRTPSASSHKRVRALLENAVQTDPNYAGAWGMLAKVYGDEFRDGYNHDRPKPLERALKAAERSVQLDHLNETGLHALFLTHYNLRNMEPFEEAARQAWAVNPNYPDMLVDLSVCRALQGELETARSLIVRAIELCPNPPGYFHGATFLLEIIEENYELALEAARKVGSSIWVEQAFFEALTLVMLQRHEEARERLDDGRVRIAEVETTLHRLFEVWNFPDFLRQRLVLAFRQIPTGVDNDAIARC
ncbi:hypothetical protein E1178_02760 [Roseibium hamelinense]|nr:hypothetical protein [Roseibium hamelinense]MTI42522.1 hypothetical protein [Roseibium hamelinense]